MFQEDHSKVCRPCFRCLDRISQEPAFASVVVSQILRGTQDSLVDIPLGDSRHGEQVANYAIVGHGSMNTILEV